MLRTYLDTNVHSAIAAGQVPAAEVEAFRAALAAGTLLAPVSLVNLDELLGQADTDRPATVSRLQTIRHLVGFHGMRKQPRDILRDAIEAYAAGIEALPITLPETERRVVVSFLVDFIAGSALHDGALREIVSGVDGLKDSWLADMQGAHRQKLADPDWARWAQRPRRERQALTFADYFAGSAPDMAEAFAAAHGCAEACRQRGLNGLLDCGPVRLCIGVALSQIYTQLVGTPGHRDLRQPARSDGYDVWHAILASTADVFVTFDGRLADHVERIPGLAGFRVVRSVKDLLTAAGA